MVPKGKGRIAYCWGCKRNSVRMHRKGLCSRCCLRQKEGRPLINPVLDNKLLLAVDARSEVDQTEIERRINIYHGRAMEAMKALKRKEIPPSIFVGFERPV